MFTIILGVDSAQILLTKKLIEDQRVYKTDDGYYRVIDDESSDTSRPSKDHQTTSTNESRESDFRPGKSLVRKALRLLYINEGENACSLTIITEGLQSKLILRFLIFDFMFSIFS